MNINDRGVPKGDVYIFLPDNSFILIKTLLRVLTFVKLITSFV